MVGPALREEKRLISLVIENSQPALVTLLLSLSIKWERVSPWIYDLHSAWRPAAETSLQIANIILPWKAERVPSLEVFIVVETFIRLAKTQS